MEDRTLVWGGERRNGQFHSRLDIFSVDVLSGKWCQYPVTSTELLLPCKRACNAAIDNIVYAFGGVISFSPLKTCNDLYKLDLNELVWEKVECRGLKPIGRYGAGMCPVNGKLLLMGGYSKFPQTKHPQAHYKEHRTNKGTGLNNELFEFDPLTGEWSALCVTGSHPPARQSHTLTAVDDNRAVLFGGNNGSNYLNDLWLFDYREKAWIEIIPSSPHVWPQPRDTHTVCTMVHDNQEIKLLLMGGNRGKQYFNDCWLIDVNQGVGTEVMIDCQPLKNRCGHSTHSFTMPDGTKILSVFGGFNSLGSIADPCFYKWNPLHPDVLSIYQPPNEDDFRPSRYCG